MNQKIKTAIFEALGEASMCWSETPKGVFDSTHAEEIGNKLCGLIDANVPQAVSVLATALKNDSGLFEGYKANIAMAFFDEYCRQVKVTGEKQTFDIHNISNVAAANFLRLLISQSETSERTDKPYLGEQNLRTETHVLLDFIDRIQVLFGRVIKVHTSVWIPTTVARYNSASSVEIVGMTKSALVQDKPGYGYTDTPKEK